MEQEPEQPKGRTYQRGHDRIPTVGNINQGPRPVQPSWPAALGLGYMQHRTRTDRDLCCGGGGFLILNAKKKRKGKEKPRISLDYGAGLAVTTKID